MLRDPCWNLLKKFWNLTSPMTDSTNLDPSTKWGNWNYVAFLRKSTIHLYRLCSSSFDNRRDIPLQCLDARALLLHTTASTPGSSLDLEWEHEALPISMVNDPSGSSWLVVTFKSFVKSRSQFIVNFVFWSYECICRAVLEPSSKTYDTESSLHNIPNTESDWSRVSSANSLEWDNVPNSFQANSPISEVDTDTQLLLSEIERLTIQTLSETGRELFSWFLRSNKLKIVSYIHLLWSPT